tara:strand:- start:473 stop:1702 length:1230 start_codon:yes stop_codon:yes gene_type:complete
MTQHVSPEELAAAVSAEFKTAYADLSKKTEDQAQVLDEIKRKSAAKEDVTDLTNRLSGITDEVKNLAKLADEMDKKMSRPGGSREEQKSFGQRIMESDEFKSFHANGGGRMQLSQKAILTADVTVPTSTTYWGVPKEQMGVVIEPRKPLTMRDLIPVGRTNSNAIEFPQWVRGDMAADVVAEGALKPESAITVPTLATVPIRTIAHWVQQSKQLMDDSPAFQTILDQEMRRGVAEAEDDQILNGDGTGQNLTGLLPNATAFNQSAAANGIPSGTGASMVDVIRWAKLSAAKKFYPADAIVLNPEDWAKIELLKDTQDAYLFSAFASGAEPRLWGLRVVENWSIPAGKFLVGGFSTGARIWDREQSNVVISTEDRDNFVKNMITIRAEERIALTVTRPDAFVYGDYTITA